MARPDVGRLPCPGDRRRAGREVLRRVLGGRSRHVDRGERRNLREIFDTAPAPTLRASCFLDEIDALGQKAFPPPLQPGDARHGEPVAFGDGLGKGNNDGVFVLGRDQSSLGRRLRAPAAGPVGPHAPGHSARRSTPDGDSWSTTCETGPLDSINLGKLAAATEHFSGADLAHLCDGAAELAMEASVRSGELRMITMKDFAKALKDVRPSTSAWLEDARNVVSLRQPRRPIRRPTRVPQERRLA